MNMTKSYNECTNEELLNFNHANFIKVFEWYTKTPKGNIYQDKRIHRFETERLDPLWNGVLASNHAEDTDEAIKLQLEYYKSKDKLGMMWYLFPSTQPPDMKERLESYGFTNINPLASPFFISKNCLLNRFHFSPAAISSSRVHP